MKTIWKAAGWVTVLSTVLLLALYLIMLHGLTRMMHEVVLPRIKKQTGIDAVVGRVSFDAADSRLFLNDIKIRNPEGFLFEHLALIDRIEVEISLKSLFRRQPLRVKNVEIGNVRVNVVRNRHGEINLHRLKQKISTNPSKKQLPAEAELFQRKEAAQDTEPDGKPVRLPELLFEQVWCKAAVRYVDLQLGQLDITLVLDAKAVGISTLRASDAPWGAAVIKGTLENDHRRFTTDMSVRLAPVTDPKTLSFDLDGQMMKLDTFIMDSAFKRLQLRHTSFDIELRFRCRENRFIHSHIDIDLQNIEFEEKLSDKLGGMKALDSLRFTVPVKGTLQELKVDVRQALVEAVKKNMRSLLGAWLQEQAAKKDDQSVSVILKNLADGQKPDSNAPAPLDSDSVINFFGRHIEEIKEEEALKKEVKKLGRRLFGK